MDKLLAIYKISFIEEFVYRLNFIMWRVRNVIQTFLVFFLWDAVFSSSQTKLFGYDRSKILTYVFALIFVRALVLSSRAIDVSGDVARGDIINLLLKPINYFKFWLTRDLSSKSLNLIFAVIETLILFIILKPPFYLQTNPFLILAFIFLLLISIFTYFLLTLLTGFLPFWYPEAAWGVNFLFLTIITEFLSGSIFPLDILPQTFTKILEFTPFPYLVFFPIEVYLGKVDFMNVGKGIAISLGWAVILWFLTNAVWKKGLKVFQAYGR